MAYAQEPVQMYFFWGQGCPHCEKLAPYIDSLQKKYPSLEVRRLEVKENAENGALLDSMAKAYGRNASGLPVIFVGDSMFEGYNGWITEKKIEGAVINCTQKACEPPEQKLKGYKNCQPSTNITKTTSTTTSTSTTSPTTTTSTQPKIQEKTTSPPQLNNDATLYLFWGQGCPHCEEMKPFIAEMEAAYPRLTVKAYEVFDSQTNADTFTALSKAYGKTASGVPTVFIGDQMIVGYVKGETDRKIEDAIVHCLSRGCADPGRKMSDHLKEHPTTLPGQATTSTQPQNQQRGTVDTAVLILGAAFIVLIAVLAFYVIRNKPKTR